MCMTDPLADLFTRIRNGSKAKFEKVDVPASRIKREVVRILKEEGFVKNFKILNEDGHDVIRVFLKYDEGRKGIIHLRRVSRPGRRVYAGTATIRPVMSGIGFSILSTPKGILTDKAAREAHVGGEVICNVW